jgi:hypothetical protein
MTPSNTVTAPPSTISTIDTTVSVSTATVLDPCTNNCIPPDVSYGGLASFVQSMLLSSCNDSVLYVLTSSSSPTNSTLQLAAKRIASAFDTVSTTDNGSSNPS